MHDFRYLMIRLILDNCIYQENLDGDFDYRLILWKWNLITITCIQNSQLHVG